MKKLITLTLASGLVLAACGADDDNNKKEDNATEQASETKTTDNALFKLADAKTSPEDAVKTAQAEQKGDLESISLEKKNGALEYEVTLQDGKTQHEIKIDDETNKVKKVESDTDDDKDQTFDLKDAVSLEDALDAAKKEFDGEHLKEWKLDHDNNRLQYQFEIVNGDNQKAEVELDAKTKDIINVDKD